MDDREKQIQLLFTAELQFRLASAVRLAVSEKQQPLDLPMVWTHGKHTVKYEEIALRQDQADYASHFLHRSATYLMAVAIKDAISWWTDNGNDKEKSSNPEVKAACAIATLIRNAFAHAPFAPEWSIKNQYRDKNYSIPDVISLDTTGRDGQEFDWRHYGGPLALFRLSQFVRTKILGGSPERRTLVPFPKEVIYQQGNLILTKIDGIPPNAVPKGIDELPDETPG